MSKLIVQTVANSAVRLFPANMDGAPCCCLPKDEIQHRLIDLTPYSSWKRASTSTDPSALFAAHLLDYQTHAHQGSVLHFALCHTDDSTLLPAIVNEAMTQPVKIQQRLSSNSAEFFRIWIRELISQPVAFARAVRSFFHLDPADLPFFACSTFPALFYAFKTQEFHELGFQFLTALLDSSPSPFFTCFLAVYIDPDRLFTFTFRRLFNEFF
jgi:hypothetical protein